MKNFRKHFQLYLLISITSLATPELSANKIFIKDFGVNETTIDATSGVIEALKFCKTKKNCELVFEQGVYHFYPDRGVDKYCFVSNNDEGLKRIVFFLENFHDFTIDGRGSTFVFHGFVNPCLIENSSNIVLKNFSIDFARPFHNEGIILACNENELDLEFTEDFPFQITNNVLQFTNGKAADQVKTTVSRNDIYHYSSLLEFDSEKKETAYMVKDYYLDGPLVAETLGANKVRVFLKGIKGTPGNIMVFSPNHRNHPGFILSDSQDITFDRVTIHHSGGMGIIGQRVHNFKAEYCQVLPSKDRIISCTADATHFTNCTGKIELSHCVFMNQMDDATNIHGIYVQINEILTSNEIIVELKHTQQFGFDFLKKGKKIEFVESQSLLTQGATGIVKVERINKQLTKVLLSNNVPEGIKVGDAICELRDFPEIHIHDNYIGKNRARGMLLNCRGKTVVENNIFHSPGAAILFEGDASYWFEQGGVNNCIIRNNTFDNCLFGTWGSAIIDVAAGIKTKKNISRYNKNIQIYDNLFRVFEDSFILNLYCVDNLVFKNNQIEYTDMYPRRIQRNNLFKIEHSDNIQIDLIK